MKLHALSGRSCAPCIVRRCWQRFCVASLPACAQSDDGVQESPFVAHRLALQLSDRAPDKQALVLSVANEMLKQYGMDKIAIDVVAFGPGIDLLRADSPNRAGWTAWSPPACASTSA